MAPTSQGCRRAQLPAWGSPPPPLPPSSATPDFGGVAPFAAVTDCPPGPTLRLQGLSDSDQPPGAPANPSFRPRKKIVSAPPGPRSKPDICSAQ